MIKELDTLSEKFERLIHSPLLSFDYVASLKDQMGVYLIYQGNHLLYIGKTNKFHVRFGTDLKHETTHTLVRKIIAQGELKNRAAVVDYFKNKCTFRIEYCDTNRQCEALEALAIYILSPTYNR